jgi:hypothetical protein
MYFLARVSGLIVSVVGLSVSVLPIAYQSHRSGTGFETTAAGSGTIF